MFTSILFKWFSLTYNAVVLLILQSLYLLDIFPENTFTYKTFIFGMIGSIAVLVTEIVIRLRQQDENDPKAKDFTSKTWLVFSIQPIGAAISSFIACGAYRTYMDEGILLLGRGYSPRVEVFIGILAGIFYIWVFKPETLKWIANSILGKFVKRFTTNQTE